jgi:large subunit ribosomal protein L4
MKRLSLLSMISDKARTGNLVILERLELETPKTKGMVRVLDAIDVDGSVLLVADGSDRSTLRTATNIPNLKMLPADLLNTVDLLNHLKLVMTLDAVRRAEELWGGPFVRQRTVGQANGEGG